MWSQAVPSINGIVAFLCQKCLYQQKLFKNVWISFQKCPVSYIPGCRLLQLCPYLNVGPTPHTCNGYFKKTFSYVYWKFWNLQTLSFQSFRITGMHTFWQCYCINPSEIYHFIYFLFSLSLLKNWRSFSSHSSPLCNLVRTILARLLSII